VPKRGQRSADPVSRSPQLPGPQSARIDRAVLRVAIVVVLGSIMSVLDTTIVNVALDSLGRGLHSSLDDIQWVVTGYLLSLAAVIPVTGWAARRFGARRLYLLSIVLFTLGSVLCGLAWSTGSLVFFRVLQGVGGGLILPIGQMILARAAGPQRMGRLMSVISIPVVMAPILGPTLGGLLLEHLGWRWIFFVNIPVGIAAVVLALRQLPRDAGSRDEAGRLDLAGLALLATGLVGITYGLAETGVASVLSGRVAVPLLAGVALTVAFVLRALRVDRPLLDVRLYANRAFASASITTFCLGAAVFGAMILMPLYFQTVRGQDAVSTGLLLAPQGIGVAAAMFLSGRAADRIGGGRVALTGVLLTAAATVPFALFGSATSYWVIGGAMVVRGIGIGMAFLPAMAAAFAAMTPAQIPDATPQLNVLQRVGGSIGTAILAVALQGHINGLATPTPGGLAHAFRTTYWWAVAVTLLAAFPAIVLVRAERAARRRSIEASAAGAVAEPAPVGAGQ
jgi:EmrB/QacA subfamily drug resistance transporter